MSLVPVQNVLAQSFELEGEIAHVLTSSGQRTTNLTKHFKAYVRDDQWRIESRSVVPQDAGTTIVGYDGQDQYRLFIFGSKQSAGAETQKARNSAAAEIIHDPVPFPRDDCVGVIWLAVASHLHLPKHSSQSGIRPQWILPASDTTLISYRLPVKYSLTSGDPQLTRVVAFFNSGKRFSLSGGKIMLTDEEPRFAFGYTNGLFRVTEFTNIQGSELPAKFELLQYRPNRSKPIVTFEVASMYSAECSRVKLGCVLQNLIPDPIPLTATTDYRARLVKTNLAFIQYDVTNRWRLLSEKGIQERLSLDAKAKPTEIEIAGKPARMALLVFLAASTLLLVGFGVKINSRKSNKTNI